MDAKFDKMDAKFEVITKDIGDLKIYEGVATLVVVAGGGAIGFSVIEYLKVTFFTAARKEVDKKKKLDIFCCQLACT